MAANRGGFREHTIVVYAADNGLALGAHGLLGKQSVYEHSMRVPLVIAGPWIPAGKESFAFAYLFDLFPTLCGLADVKPPPGIDGRDLGPILRGEAVSVRDAVFLPFLDLQRAVRDDRWKLIVYPRIGYQQLFDLRGDPEETRNLAADPGFGDVLRRMRGMLDRERERYGDSAPLAVAVRSPGSSIRAAASGSRIAGSRPRSATSTFA